MDAEAWFGVTPASVAGPKAARENRAAARIVALPKVACGRLTRGTGNWHTGVQNWAENTTNWGLTEKQH
jgi:hypothetical protein